MYLTFSGTHLSIPRESLPPTLEFTSPSPGTHLPLLWVFSSGIPPVISWKSLPLELTFPSPGSYLPYAGKLPSLSLEPPFHWNSPPLPWDPPPSPLELTCPTLEHPTPSLGSHLPLPGTLLPLSRNSPFPNLELPSPSPWNSPFTTLVLPSPSIGTYFPTTGTPLWNSILLSWESPSHPGNPTPLSEMTSATPSPRGHLPLPFPGNPPSPIPLPHPTGTPSK
ncbi:uncharacterized protein LOC135213829 [Macrobrachium nipponense]|uniref:uncharacterized protein LOC135213829 n=1 Tax=Macrobrachium nipponense TaxID=159736 RepID=UPI0030C8744A